MADMPKTIPVPFKLAVVGVAFCVEPSAELREEIQEAVRSALEALPWVKVDGQFFQWHNVEIKVVTDGQ